MTLNLSHVLPQLIEAQGPCLLLRFPEGNVSTVSKVVMMNQAFCDLFMNGITEGCPMTWNWETHGEIDINTIRKSTQFLYPDDNWEEFEHKTNMMYDAGKDPEPDYWRFNGDIWIRKLTYIETEDGVLLGLWTYTSGNNRFLMGDEEYRKERSDVLKTQLWNSAKAYAVYTPVRNEEGKLVNAAQLWHNPSWEVFSPNTAYKDNTLLSEGTPERFPVFLEAIAEAIELGSSSLNVPRFDKEGMVSLLIRHTVDNFLIVTFEMASLFTMMVDQASPTFIMKINSLDPTPENNTVVCVNKHFADVFFNGEMPNFVPQPKTFGSIEIPIDEFLDLLQEANPTYIEGGDNHKENRQSWWRAYRDEVRLSVVDHVVLHGFTGSYSTNLDSPYGAFNRIATFITMEDGNVYLVFSFETASQEALLNAPEFAERRTNLLGQQVNEVSRAIAAHKPIFDEDGTLVDMEFLWANQEFNRWRRRNVKPGMLNSTERIRFDELLPYLQRAWEEGQAAQFFTLNSDVSSELVDSIYDYEHLLGGENESVTQIEIETLFTRTPDGYIIEWGDDVNAKIKHGSEIELQRRLVEDLEREKVQQRERDHFISEIHDNTLQELFVIGMGLQPYMKEGGPTPTADNVHEFAGAIDRIAKDLRSLITDEMEQRDPFNEQLKVLAERYNRISDFDVVFVNASSDEASNLERIPPNLCDDLSKATQEAISNAVKHSGGDQITIRFTMESNNITLTIDDNGTGIEDVTTRRSGTRNMAQRIEKHQGSFSLENLTDGGTRVVFKIENIPLVNI